MNDLKELLSRRYAGIPGYVIGIVVAVLVVVAVRIFSGRKTATTQTAQDAGVGDNVDGVSGDPTGVVNPVFTANTPPTNGQVTAQSDTAAAQTNDTWTRAAVAWLVGTGKASESDARLALQRYIGGETLTVSQDALKNAAIGQFGLPPDLPSGGGVEQAPAFSGPAVQQGKPPTVHTVRGTADNTTAELARLYYGRNDELALNTIRAANVFHLGDTYAVGTKVNIPAYQAPRFVRTVKGMQTPDQIGAKNGTSGSRILALNTNIFRGVSRALPIGTSVRVA